MPDWSYRTVIRPLLFQAPAAMARNFALRAMGGLARLPGGSFVIDFLGHMSPDSRLQRNVLGIASMSPVGLGPGLDVHADALTALSRFGFGFLEVGPITPQPVEEIAPVQRDDKSETVLYPKGPPNPGAAGLADRLQRGRRLRLPLFIRVRSTATAAERMTSDCVEVVAALTPHAVAFVLDTLYFTVIDDWSEDVWTAHLSTLCDAAAGKPLLLCVPLDAEWETVEPRLRAAWSLGIRGFVLDGKLSGLIGAPARGAASEMTAALRKTFGVEAAIVAAGGVHEPAHVLQLLDAGANLVQIDTGLVYSGPGLPKRCNEAILHREFAGASGPTVPINESSWLWALLMGLAMFGGGILALLIAATRVVLPYDEVLGMTREQLASVNPRLLAFMAHDRVSLAGTMIAVGIFYSALAWYGIRTGEHWAKRTALISAMAGFFSFFSFLGFGYFDPFHAFVTAILFQLLLMAWHGKLADRPAPPAADLHDDSAWKRNQWGQLLFVVHGVGLIGAGIIISCIGSSSVFVREDLEFMRTTREALLSESPRLLPLVAHDRASFGGMLIASGLCVLLPALWGFRRGAAWVWWMMLWAPLPGYAAAIGVHLVVGYDDWFHLTPAFAGAQLWIIGLLLSRRYLCDSGG